ncbi:MAG: 3'-5' exonuclease [Acidobacteriota bacterium]
MGEYRPDIVLTHPNIGVICVSCRENEPFETQILSLNSRIAGLRSDIQEIEGLPVLPTVVTSSKPGPDVRTGVALVLQPDEFESGQWIKGKARTAVDEALISKVDSRLQPHLQFLTKAKQASVDPDATEREEWRFILDQQQAETAHRDVDDVLLITGPPGSGKTLVLVARARWLAMKNPGQTIFVISYNKLLAKHIGSLLNDCPNITVSYFGEFASGQGHRINQISEERSNEDVRRILAKNPGPFIDALFIDEWQDFHPAWLRYLSHLVRRGRNSISLAGDERQGIYRSEFPREGLNGRAMDQVNLTRPYRSTKQILEIADLISDDNNIEGRESAPDGPPIDLIFADSWDAQADAIAWEIEQLIHRGERSPGNIAAMGTRKNTIARLVKSLEARQIPHCILDGSELPDPDRVSILTVHKAKGYEFPVVFLMAIEALPKPEGGPANLQKRRVGFVGPTRAQDQLFVTYTRPNDMVEKLLQLRSDSIRYWVYPDEYEVT